MCNHPRFETHVAITRLEDSGGFMAEIQIRCKECKVRFRFVGLPMGLSFQEPMVSVDNFELRAPIEPDAHLTSLMAGRDTGFPAFPE